MIFKGISYSRQKKIIPVDLDVLKDLNEKQMKAKKIDKYLDNSRRIDSIQTTRLLRSARILRRDEGM